MATKEEILARVAESGGSEYPLNEQEVGKNLGYSDPAEVFGARWPSADQATRDAAKKIADEAEGWNAATSVDAQRNVVDLLVHRLKGSSRRSPRRTASARGATACKARATGLVSAWCVEKAAAAEGAVNLWRNRKSGLSVRVARGPRGKGFEVFMGRRNLTGAPLPTKARAMAFASEVMRRQGDRT